MKIGIIARIKGLIESAIKFMNDSIKTGALSVAIR